MLNYKKPAFWIIVAAVIACIVTAICLLPNTKPDNDTSNEYSYAEQLFEYRTAYVGDNSAVANIVDLLNFPDDVAYDHIELQTDSEPYGVSVYFNVIPEGKANYDLSELENVGIFRKNACIMFSLIENVDTVSFLLDSGSENPVNLKFNREWAENIVGEDLWEESASAEKLDSLITLISESVGSTYVSAGEATAGNGNGTEPAEGTNPSAEDEAVSSALLHNNQDGYSDGECSGEGHIILGSETMSGVTKVYALTMFGEYGFEDGNFVKVSGTGIIPAVFTFTASDGGLACTGIMYPEDGTGYGKSIAKMFPSEYQDRALNPTDGDMRDLKAQERSYAESYLKEIGRDAVIGDYGDFEHTLLTDLGVSVAVSNSIAANSLFFNYPMWLGSREALENGVRWVYEKSYDENAHEIDFTKYEYDTDAVAEVIRVDSVTGEILGTESEAKVD